MKTDIVGVMVDNITKTETIQKIDDFVRSNKPHLIVTVYSEFIVFASHDSEYRKVLNSANLSLADGFGILWAAKYLSLTTNHFPLATLIRALYDKAYFKNPIPEVITGSRLIWDIAELSAQKNYSLALVGGGDSVAAQTSNELKKVFPNLKINLALSGGIPFNEQTAQEINRSNSDILLIAYSPPKQETWLAQNLHNLSVKVAIGLGGTFDYIAKKRLPAPEFAQRMGLEWLWRLITQPYRIKRIWNAVPVFIWKVYKYKINVTSPQGRSEKGL